MEIETPIRTSSEPGGATPRRRVAFVAFHFVEYAIPIANALAREADVLLLVPAGDVAAVRDEIDERRLTYSPFSKPRLRQPLRQAATCVDLVRRIDDFQPDVVHLQQGHFWFNCALPFLRRYPLVVTIHDHRYHVGDRSSQRTPQRIMDFGFRRASRLIVHGEQIRSAVERELGIPRARIHVIPNLERAGAFRLGEAGDSSVRDPGHGADGNGEGDGAPKVLFFGRIWPYKGLEYLVRAQPLISQEVPEARIVIAGEGEDLDRYTRLMVDRDRFVVHNEFVSNAERARLFSEAAVVVLPYVEATQSAVVAVAYSFRKPVVASAVGAIPEIVDDGETGYLVPPRDTHALAARVVELLRDPERRRAFGENGRDKIVREFSAEAAARRTLEVYDLAIDQPRRGSYAHRAPAASAGRP